MSATTRSGDLGSLCELISQSEMSGASRRVAVLHTDRLPPLLKRPHHLRLARQALDSLAAADRAQVFELSRGRISIVWRSKGEAELAAARIALGLLISGEPAHEDELLTLYDLPGQAISLLDAIADPVDATGPQDTSALPLDPLMLVRLEASLSNSDLSRFARWRSIMTLPTPADGVSGGGSTASAAWNERSFDMRELAANICPDRQLTGDPWLFRRLTRTLDSRMLAMLIAKREMREVTTFAFNVNVATILSEEFLRFDASLPTTLRGEVILNLRAPDILSDAAGFTFARNFATARGYRLALAGATIGLLKFFDVANAGFQFVKVALTPEFQAKHKALTNYLPPEIPVIVTGLNRPSDLRWAVQSGFRLGRGRALSP